MPLGLDKIFRRRRTPEEIEADRSAVIPNARVYDIVDSHANLSKQLGEHCVSENREWEHLRELRVDAFAARHPNGYRPHDVFSETPIVPVVLDHMPKTARLKKTAPRALPEFSWFNGMTVISQRVHDVLQDLEPGRHRFLPLTVTRHDDTESYRYYFLQFLEKTDCVCLPLSGFQLKKSPSGVVYWAKPKDCHQKYYLWADCVGDRHIFWDSHAKGRVFVSQKLVDTLGDFLPRGIELVENGLLSRRET